MPSPPDVSSSSPVIAVSGLEKRFGRARALAALDLEVGRGEVVGLLGPNGAGKSTLMRILAGLLPFRVGTVVVGGVDVARDAQRVRPRVGYLPENVPLYPELRVSEFLDFRAKLKGLSRSERRARIDEVIDRCDLGDRRRAIIRHLSKGFRQRVGLADLLLGRPSVLLLDEPTSGLDPRQIAQFRELVQDLRESATILWSSHIVGELEQRCDSIVVIVGGSIRRRIDLRSRTAGVYLEVERAPGTFEARLTALPGVTGVSTQGVGWWIDGDEDLAPTILSAIGSELHIVELRSGVRYLERIYLETTREADA